MVRRLPVLVISAIALSSLSISARQQAATGVREAVINEFDQQLARDFARDGIGGMSVGIVSGNALVWSKHYGYADVEAKRVATNQSDYRIGSITKQFTALALLQLVEQGRMRLSDPIEKYVPEIRSVKTTFPNAPPITILQAATMMSGLAREPGCANHSIGPVSTWQQKVLECLPQTSFALEPGTAYLYSNIGYATLGLAIERAAGKPYVDVVTDNIFKPLRMTGSAFVPTSTMRETLAHGYVARDGKGDRTQPDQELDGRGYRVPNGAILSTITDLAKFVAWELGDGPQGVLKKDTQEANYRRVYSATSGNAAPQVQMTDGYGLGFQATRRGDVVMLGHGGSTAGYHASLLFHRPTKIGVIVLRGCDSCAVDAGPVAMRLLEKLVAATK